MNGIGFFAFFIVQLALLPLTGLNWIISEDGGIIKKVAGFCMLIIGIILWAGILKA